jgi:hypothetical protein
MAGAWGVSPHKTKRRGDLPTLATPPRVGPKTLANPQPTRVGKRGIQGAQAPWQGVWGMSPQNLKRGASSPLLPTSPRVGPKTLANPKPMRVGKQGVQGGEAPWQGVWGMCPQNFQRRGRVATLAPCHEWDPKRRQTLSLRGWANGSISFTHKGRPLQFRNTPISFSNLTRLLFYAIFIVERNSTQGLYRARGFKSQF